MTINAKLLNKYSAFVEILFNFSLLSSMLAFVFESLTLFPLVKHLCLLTLCTVKGSPLRSPTERSECHGHQEGMFYLQ